MRLRLGALLTAAAFLAWSLALAQLELHFIDVGQGDAVLVRAPAGQVVVYDGGRSPRTALEHLRSVGVESVDLVVASHAHADHIGGLVEIVDAYRPRFFLDNGIPHTTLVYERLLDAVLAAGSQLLEPGERRISLGEVTLHVLPVPGFSSWGHNDNSVGVMIEYGEFRASLTGDAEPRQFDWWLSTVPEAFAQVQVHKASHHGSANGDTEAALARLQPEVVVVSAGANNAYGHPHAEALQRYAAVGATVFRTDLHGHVRVQAESDGSYEVSTERESPGVRGTPPPPPAASPTAPPAAAPAPAPSVGCVDLNSASLGRLQDIIHIGPERARAIEALRPFTRVDQLERVSGIGPARMRDIREQGLACVR